MMWIELINGMSGTRANGDRYPPMFTPFQVADWEGENLVRAEVARRVAAPAIVPPEPLPVPAHAMPPEPARAPAQEPAQDTGRSFTPEDAQEPAPEPAYVDARESAQESAWETAPGPAQSRRPVAADPKQAWIDHAISQGADPDTAARMTKADLQSRYGSRL